MGFTIQFAILYLILFVIDVFAFIKGKENKKKRERSMGY